MKKYEFLALISVLILNPGAAFNTPSGMNTFDDGVFSGSEEDIEGVQTERMSDGRNERRLNESSSSGSYVNNSYIIKFEEDSSSESGEIGVLDKAGKTGSVRKTTTKQKVVSSIEKESQEQVKIKEEYEKSFRGITVENVSNSTIEQINQMDGVENVYRDRILHLHLSDSVENIGAAKLHSRKIDGVNFTGKGVEVAVIDSGTDYKRPSLGGCTFEQMNNSDPGDCRFLPSYDFVDQDYDPMDEKHGTHVAGILGANGPNITGVAPGVKMRSYRVCDSGCRTSDVIAAVQRAMDPDNDGDTSDHVDIIQMSLGGPGYPSGVMSQVVNEATEVGVISVISAGNSGSLSETVGSPAAAKTSLAVGSVNDDDQLNQFSSRGPQKVKNSTELLMKPEISAPGYKINSTYEANFTEISGTSMAAPHVSGAAALLLQKHPNLKPEEIKGVLTATSTKVEKNNRYENVDLTEAGAGRINVTEAINTTSVTAPEALSFGLSNFTQGEWNKSKNLSIRNFGNHAKNYTISVNNIPTGASFDFDNSAFTLHPEESRKIRINLSTNRSKLQQDTYTGIFKINSNESEKLRIPYMFKHEDFSLEVGRKKSRTGIYRLHLESPYEYSKTSKDVYITHPDNQVTKIHLNKRGFRTEKNPEDQDWYKRIHVNQTGQYTAKANSTRLPGKEDTVNFTLNNTKPSFKIQSTPYQTEDKLGFQLKSNSTLSRTSGRITPIPSSTNLFLPEIITKHNKLHIIWGEEETPDGKFSDVNLKYSTYQDGEVNTQTYLNDKNVGQIQSVSSVRKDEKALIAWNGVTSNPIKCDNFCHVGATAIIDLEEDKLQKKMRMGELVNNSDLESIDTALNRETAGISWLEDSGNRSSDNVDTVKFRMYNFSSGNLSKEYDILFNTSKTLASQQTLSLLPTREGFELFWFLIDDEGVTLYNKKINKSGSIGNLENVTDDYFGIAKSCKRVREDNICLTNRATTFANNSTIKNKTIFTSKSSEEWKNKTYHASGSYQSIESSNQELSISYSDQKIGSTFGNSIEYRVYNGSWSEPREIDSSTVGTSIPDISKSGSRTILGIKERDKFIPTSETFGTALQSVGLLSEHKIGNSINKTKDFDSPIIEQELIDSENYQNILVRSKRNTGYYDWTGGTSLFGTTPETSFLKTSKPPRVDVILPNGEAKTSYLRRNGDRWQTNFSTKLGGPHLYKTSAVDQYLNLNENFSISSINTSDGSNKPPSKPEWNGPVGNVKDASPLLNWSEPSDPEDENLRYAVILDNDSDFNSPEVFKNVNKTQYETELSVKEYSNSTFNYKVLSTDLKQSSEVTRGSFNVTIKVDFEVGNNTKIHENISINSTNKGKINVSRTGSIWNYSTLMEKKAEKYTATLPLHNKGYYDITYRRTEEDLNGLSETKTIFVNSSKPALGGVNVVSGWPVEGYSFSVRSPLDTGTGIEASSVKVSNETRNISAIGVHSVSEVTGTDPVTGESYSNYSDGKVGINIEEDSLSSGLYNVSFEVENAAGNRTSNFTQRVVGYQNFTVNVTGENTSSRGFSLQTLGFNSKNYYRASNFTGSTNISAPNLTAVQDDFSLATFENPLSNQENNSYILDNSTNVSNSVELNVSGIRERRKVGDKIIYSIFGSDYQGKRSANASKIYIIRKVEDLKSRVQDYNELTIYSCSNFSFTNKSCNEEWKNPQNTQKSVSDGIITINSAVNLSEAVALGEIDGCVKNCQTEDETDSDTGGSGGSSDSGTISDSSISDDSSGEKPQINETEDGVSITDLQQGSTKVESVSNIKSVNIQTESDKDISLEINPDNPSKQSNKGSSPDHLNKVASYSMSVKVNGEQRERLEDPINLNFSVDKEKIQEMNAEPEQISLFHKEDETWDRVKTEYIEEEDIYTAELSEFSRYMIAAERQLCPQVITYAEHPQTGECRRFSTPCQVPDDWEKVKTCENKNKTTAEVTEKMDGTKDESQLAQSVIVASLVASLLGGIILVIRYRSRKRKDRIEELATVSGQVKDKLEDGKIKKDQRLLALLDETKVSIENNNLKKSNKKLKKIKEIINKSSNT